MARRKTFGSELRRIREDHPDSVSMKTLADAIGVSVVYISDIERDRRNPPSAKRIGVLLETLDASDRLDEMVELAAISRKSVEISVKDKSDDAVRALASLARRAETGEIPEAVWKQLLALVSEGKGG